MMDTIGLLLSEFVGGVISVFNWRPTALPKEILYPLIGLTAVLCRILGVVLSVGFVIFLISYSSFSLCRLAINYFT